jgi:PatG Domain
MRQARRESIGATVALASADAGELGALGDSGSCPACGSTEAVDATMLSYVYALGRIEARFPRLSVEKEFAHALAAADTTNKTDWQAFRAVVESPINRYLVRQLCWTLTVQGLEAYLLQPRDPADFQLLADAAGGPNRGGLISLVIGIRGPIARPELCNGLTVPIVAFDQIYSFDRETLIGAIPRPDGVDADRFRTAASEVFDRIMLLTDNAGAADDHRAVNYLAVRYPGLYAMISEAYARNLSLSGVETVPSLLPGSRRILDVIFTLTSRATDVVEKQFVRVDVSDEFPFLVSKLAPYVER